jgi:hypothetical protein
MLTHTQGLLLSLFITSVTAVMQSALLRVPAVRAALNIPQYTPPPPGDRMPTMMDTFREYVYPRLQQQQQQQQGQTHLGGIPRVQAYVPPKAPTPIKVAAFPPASASAAPMPAAPPTKPPRTLEMMAQRAQAHPSAKGSSLFEGTDAPAAPAKTGKSKKAKAKRA